MWAGEGRSFGHDNQTSGGIGGRLTVTIDIRICTKDTTLAGLGNHEPRTLRAHPAHHSGAVGQWGWGWLMAMGTGHRRHAGLVVGEWSADISTLHCGGLMLARFLADVLLKFLGQNTLLLHAIAVAHGDGAVLK